MELVGGMVLPELSSNIEICMISLAARQNLSGENEETYRWDLWHHPV